MWDRILQVKEQPLEYMELQKPIYGIILSLFLNGKAHMNRVKFPDAGKEFSGRVNLNSSKSVDKAGGNSGRNALISVDTMNIQ